MVASVIRSATGRSDGRTGGNPIAVFTVQIPISDGLATGTPNRKAEPCRLSFKVSGNRSTFPSVRPHPAFERLPTRAAETLPDEAFLPRGIGQWLLGLELGGRCRPVAAEDPQEGSWPQWALLLLIVLGSLVIYRPFCNYICPLAPVVDYVSDTRSRVKQLWQHRSNHPKNETPNPSS